MVAVSSLGLTACVNEGTTAKAVYIGCEQGTPHTLDTMISDNGGTIRTTVRCMDGDHISPAKLSLSSFPGAAYEFKTTGTSDGGTEPKASLGRDGKITVQGYYSIGSLGISAAASAAHM